MGSANLDWKKVTLDVLVWADIIVFSLALAYALYNGTNFLIIQRRYNNFYLVTFYLLTVLVFGIRVIYFTHTFITWDYSEARFDSTWGTWIFLAL